MKVLNITTADGETFKAEWDIALQSLTFKNMLEVMGIEQESNTDDTIPITNDEVTGENFKKALVWMEKNRSKPVVQKNDDEDELKPKEPVNWEQLDDWEKKFVDMPVSEMFPLLITANFLEIPGLLNLMCKAVALQIQGKAVEDIRTTFNIEDPKWSPEELQKLKEENAWAYETKK
jgi:S-phase kinase-associated protein 1